MLLKYLQPNREPNNPTGSAPVAPTPASVAEPRQPSTVELSTEFKDDLGIDVEAAAEPQGKTPVTAAVVEPTKPEPIKPAEVKPIIPAAKVEITPKVEPVKVEAKVEAKVAPLKPSGEVTPILPPSAQPKARDYSGFSTEESAVLKAMPNEQFNFASKVLRENKELSKLKDSTFLQHPQAFILDPQFQTLQQDIHFLKQEENHWRTQLILAQDGNEWQPIEGFNQDGSPKLGIARKPTKEDVEQIRQAMYKCSNMATNSEGQVQQFASNYQQRIKEGNLAIQSECQKRFGWVADPKLMDATINIPEVGDKTIKDIHAELVNMFPPYHRQTPGVQVAAHMFVALQIYAAQIRELQNGKEVAEVKATEVTRAEPTSELRPAAPGAAINGVTEFSLEGMPT